MRLVPVSPFPLVFCSLAAMAAADPPPLPQVDVKAPDSSQLRRDDSLGRIVVGRDDLQRYGDTTLADALKRQPGLSVVGTEVRMRGLGGGYTRFLIDGQPAPANFDVAALSPDLVERIEIQRSAQADASAQAVAGAIDIILRKAAGADRQTMTISAARQAGATSPAATAQWTRRRDAVGYGVTATASDTRQRDQLVTDERAAAGAHSADGAAGAAGADSADGANPGAAAVRRLTDRDATRTRRLSAAPRADLRPGGGGTLTWQGLFDLARSEADGTQAEATLQGAPTAWPDARWRSRFDSRLLKSDATWLQQVGAGKVTIKAGAEDSRRQGDYLFNGSDAAGVAWLDRAVRSRAAERRMTTSGKFVRPLAGGHDMAVGWEASQVRRAEDRRQRDTRAGAGANAASEAHAPNAPTYGLDQDYHASVRQLALFAQDEWAVTARLQAYLGLRWEGLATGTRDAGHGTTASRVFSPVAQLLWKLPGSARDQVRVALARTYKAPQPRDLVPRRYTVNNDNSPAQPDYQGNPLLRPELAWGLDAAWESYIGRDGVISVSAYARRIRDVMLTRLWQEDGVWVSSLANSGPAVVQGVEIDVRMPLALASATRPGVALRANLGRNWSRVAGMAAPDNRLGNQAPLTANLGADLQLPGAWPGAATAGGNVRVVGGWRARTAQSLIQGTGVV
ncbi:MAG: TonB-dependent receptor, partial [Duganella sp.]